MPTDDRWLNYGIVAPVFDNNLERDHFLKKRDWIVKNAPELRYRMEGFITALADIKASIDILGKNGKYILCSTHALTEDMPVDNVIAMYDEAQIYRG